MEKTVRVYSDGTKSEPTPFNGWVYFTEYIHREDGIEMATGINRDRLERDTKGRSVKKLLVKIKSKLP